MNTNHEMIRECRVGGQGLIAGRSYIIAQLKAEIIGFEMVKTSGVVIDIDGDRIRVSNMHIAFDIDNLLNKVRIVESIRR